MLLLLLLILPLLAGLFILPLKYISYLTSVFASACIFIISVTAMVSIYCGGDSFDFASGFLILQMDGTSSLFIVLTAFLTMICSIASKEKSPGYISLFFLLEAIVIGVFCATDLLTFYILFELSLVPLFFVIGIWGSQNKIYAAYKFFLYTFVGSIGFLVAIAFTYLTTGTLNIALLTQTLPFTDFTIQKFLWIAFFIAFAVKIPMFPFHTWLPDAHVQAPTTGSVMLAGVLIKLGGYGFYRILMPLLPKANEFFTPFVLLLSTISIIYTSIVAIMQTDMKKLIAYSSVAHMGIVTAGFFSFQIEGIKGAIFQMISHGLISGALFLCIGFLYDRLKTRQIISYSGLVNKMPVFAFMFILFSMASIGLPGTSGFIGEFLSMLGLFQSHAIFAILCTTGVILSACYMLFLCKRIIWGNCTIEIQDVKLFESIPLFMLFLSVIALGIFPGFILNIIK